MIRQLIGTASLLALLTQTPAPAPAPAPSPVPAPASAPSNGQDALAKAFLEQGIWIDPAHGLCSIAATVDIRDDLLEYILVNPHGAAHESLFVTEVTAGRLNAALLALGAVPGTNARWSRKDPAPSEEQLRAGASPFDVQSPTGDGFYLYAAWRGDGETYLFRVEDLMRNLETGSSLRRHRWVYLGSRMLRLRAKGETVREEQAFAADLEGNLINLAYFEEGNTLLTAVPPECLKQTIWLPNAWLVPERGGAVQFVFSRERLSALPRELEERLPSGR